MPKASLLAVLLAALAALVAGSLWYSPLLFGRVWRTELALATFRRNDRAI